MTTPSSSYGPTGPTSIRPQQRSRKTVWIIVGSVLAVVLVCCCGGGGVAAYSITNNAAFAEGTIDSYCSDLAHLNFNTAYGLLSTHAKSQISQDKFVSEAQAVDGNPIPIDTLNDTVSLDCNQLNPRDINMTGADSVTITVNVGQIGGFGGASGCIGPITEVKELWSWKIDSYSGFSGCFPDLTPDAGGNSGG